MKKIFYFLFMPFLYYASHSQAIEVDANIIKYLVLSGFDESKDKRNQDISDGANKGSYSDTLEDIHQLDDAPDYLLNPYSNIGICVDDSIDTPDGLFSKGGSEYEKIKEEKSKWHDQKKFKIDWQFNDKTDKLFLDIYDQNQNVRTHILTIGKEKYKEEKQIICNVESALTPDQVTLVHGIGKKIIDKIKGSYFYVYLIALEQPIDYEQDDTLAAALEIGEKGKGKVYKKSTEMGNNLQDLVDKTQQVKDIEGIDPSSEKFKKKINFYLDIFIRK